ncbi:MAG: FtsQ-type POTRA domain-containing protein [Oscillatoriaceae bacterium SKW80]|nr:FtsQ-type POTRA domain-containing protein [Oscillatoriaceae bacterium SKYG93]MCX8119603.1 FtsQ-type POTRA domain-containing protein [Oscillatoriaceae bacterium SKW80]MDW8455070.1 FtsQ-type POTRA domain-containing protein [Oscillatoriaceae cyanobacterium SKYGB_i_bin93]HIK28153.1 FtsQ-type POTRA domain-containing protein [Oscillatoriaceae cyanobacterium M7585_C2015_266]
MTSIASVSQTELDRRRKQLRQARRQKVLQTVWQTFAVSSMACGLLWVSTRPGWVISQPEQVVIEGNQFLSEKTIRGLLSLSYPQSLLRLQPQEMAKKLEKVGPIAKASVTRHLFPPGLTVQIKERHPVAIAQRNATNATAAGAKLGVLDENGSWAPLESYTSLEQTVQLPTLRALGNPEEYRQYWPQVYRAVSRSAVKVFEIDMQDPSNLILKTELGTVHLGSDISKCVEQLTVLDKMRNLPQRLQSSQIAYIDLKNPASPAIKLVSPAEKTKLKGS